MPLSSRFSKPVVNRLHESKILGVKAGSEPHRYTGVWVVVVQGRVFVRSWNDKARGWHRAFLTEPKGMIQLPERELRVRARRVRSERLLNAIDQAYGEKYHTPASRKWVRGFARPRRRLTTTELVPQ